MAKSISKAISYGLLLLLAALPAAAALVVIVHCGVDVHIGDEWDPDVAGLFIKAAHHQVTFADLVRQHNEHRLLVPRLFYLLLNVFWHWNSIVDTIAGWVLACATSVGILWLMYKTDGSVSGGAESGRRMPGILARWFLCNVLIFCPAQGENWLTDWGLANALPGALTIAAIVVAADGLRSWRRLALCMLLAASATFSNGCGFAAWFVVAKLLIHPCTPAGGVPRSRALIAWGIGFAVCAWLYAIHYQSPPHSNAYTPTLYNRLFFFVTFCANAFMFTSWPWATACPLLGIFLMVLLLAAAAYCFAVWRSGCHELCKRLRVWFAVAAFSVITGIMGAMSRGGYGLEQAVISRYVTFSIYLPVALINIVPMICDDLRGRLSGGWSKPLTQFPAALAAAVLVLQIQGYGPALDRIQQLQYGRLEEKGALLLANILPTNQALSDMVHSNLPELVQEADALNEAGYLRPPLLVAGDAPKFCHPDPQPRDVVLGSFEKFEPHPEAGQAYATGWAVFSALRRPADEVFLTYSATDDRPIVFAEAEFGITRDDVAGTLHVDAYRYSGWGSVMPIGPLQHHVTTLAVRAWALDTQTGKAYALPGKAMITPQ